MGLKSYSVEITVDFMYNTNEKVCEYESLGTAKNLKCKTQQKYFHGLVTPGIVRTMTNKIKYFPILQHN